MRKNLGQIQKEIHRWSQENFGTQSPDNPLMGIAEEIGELCEAKSQGEINDACADMVIFSMNFCSIMGWDYASAVKAASIDPLPDQTGDAVAHHPHWDIMVNMIVPLGRLMHAKLKINQGIRVNEDHVGAGMLALGQLFGFADEMLDLYGVDLLQQVNDTWEEVSQRDWSSHNANGVTK